ncbi:hypothetical protein FGF1_26200 [Flavobacteriaceae bacterium GF1]
MEMTTSSLTLFAAILLIGGTAGLCFTWENAVTTGIGQLDDRGYLLAFRKMNRGIENPFFFIVFLGAFLAGIAVMYTYLKLEFGIGGGINPL